MLWVKLTFGTFDLSLWSPREVNAQHWLVCGYRVIPRDINLTIGFVTWPHPGESVDNSKKYAHGFCFAVLCCGYTLTDFPISIRLTSLALWQSNDCPSASKATLMNMDKYFMWIHHERLHNHNKVKHNKTVCIFLGIYCIPVRKNKKTQSIPSILMAWFMAIAKRSSEDEFMAPFWYPMLWLVDITDITVIDCNVSLLGLLCGYLVIRS